MTTIKNFEKMNLAERDNKTGRNIIPRMSISSESEDNYFDEQDYEIAKIKANNEYNVMMPSDKFKNNGTYRFRKQDSLGTNTSSKWIHKKGKYNARTKSIKK